MNIYGPYLYRERFWNNIFSLDCLKICRLFLVGDLNFSMGLSEVWGEMARVDFLSDFFTVQLASFGLVDIDPFVISPT